MRKFVFLLALTFSITTFADELQTGKISESQRIADLRTRVERFQKKLGQYESKWHDQANEAEYIATLTRSGDEFIVAPLLKELLDTEDGKPNGDNMPRYMHYSTAASIGEAIAKTKSKVLDAKSLIDKYNFSRTKGFNLSLRVGLTYVLAGMDTAETVKPLYKVVIDESDGDQTAVKALKSSKNPQTIDVLLNHGISHSDNGLTRREAINSIESICKKNVKDSNVLSKCIRVIFPKFLAFIKGMDALGDVEVVSFTADTVAQEAYLSLAGICEVSVESPTLVQACAVLESLKDEKRIEAQYARVNLPRILDEYIQSLKELGSSLEEYANSMGASGDSLEEMSNAYGELADSLKMEMK